MPALELVDRFISLKKELITSFINLVDSVIMNLPNFILSLFTLLLFILISKYVGRLLTTILSKTKAQKSVVVIIVKVTKVIFILIGFFVALGILNLDKVLTTVLGAAGVIGLAVGLALQGTLNNTFSGVILSFLPKIQLGDWVETNDFSGRVIDIDLRSVVIQTADQNIVVIPNSKIVDTPFKNFSRTNRGVVMVTCGVGYESDLEKVQQLTENCIQEQFSQLTGEKINFFYTGFGDSSIDFEVRFWADVKDQLDVLRATHKAVLAIKKTFNEHGINIPFPIRTLDFNKNKLRTETLTLREE